MSLRVEAQFGYRPNRQQGATHSAPSKFRLREVANAASAMQRLETCAHFWPFEAGTFPPGARTSKVGPLA